MRSFDGIKPTKEPKLFKGDLRGYQREGLGWLRFLQEFHFGGCLADDMGLGKTIQVVALFAAPTIVDEVPTPGARDARWRVITVRDGARAVVRPTRSNF